MEGRVGVGRQFVIFSLLVRALSGHKAGLHGARRWRKAKWSFVDFVEDC